VLVLWALWGLIAVSGVELKNSLFYKLGDVSTCLRPSYYEAYCTSYICCPSTRTSQGTLKVNIHKCTVDCPDCSSVLYWKAIYKGGRIRD